MSLWCPCDVLIVVCLCCLWLSQSSSVSEWRFHDAVYTVHICTHYEMATSSFFVRHWAVEKPLAAAMHELQKYRATGLLNPASHPLPWNFPCDILWQQRMNRHHGTTYRTSYETPMECSGQRGDKDWSLEETLWKNCCHRDFTSKCDKIQTLQTLLCIWSAWWHELTWHGWHGTMWYYVIMCMSGSKDSKECSLAELFWTPPCISSPHLFGFWKFDEVCNGCSRCSWHQLTGVTRCSKAP